MSTSTTESITDTLSNFSSDTTSTMRSKAVCVNRTPSDKKNYSAMARSESNANEVVRVKHPYEQTSSDQYHDRLSRSSKDSHMVSPFIPPKRPELLQACAPADLQDDWDSHQCGTLNRNVSASNTHILDQHGRSSGCQVALFFTGWYAN